MWGPKDVLTLKLGESFDITGRGKIVVCSLKENNYDMNVARKKLNEWFMDKIIVFEGTYWQIHGIDSHAAMNRVHEQVGFLIKPYGLWHQLPKNKQ